MRSRPLAVHAIVLGGGWFVLAFVSLIVVLPARAEWILNLPKPVQGAGLTLVAVVAVPLAWPVYIALGLYEGRLAERLRAGDASALQAAQRLLHVQAAVFGLGSMLAAAFAVAVRAVNGAGYVALAWLPLLAIAGAHLWTARRITSA